MATGYGIARFGQRGLKPPKIENAGPGFFPIGTSNSSAEGPRIAA